MTTLNLTTIAAATTLDPSVVNNNFGAVAAIINGNLGPDNLSTDQIHVPMPGLTLADLTIPTVTGYGQEAAHRFVIVRNPVAGATSVVNLKELLLTAYGVNATLTVVLKGHTSLANALNEANGGAAGTTISTLSIAAVLVGYYASEDLAGHDVKTYPYFIYDLSVAGVGIFPTLKVSGELVYTIQAV